MRTSTTDAARSSGPLATACFVTALVVAPVGFLLFALSEGSGDRLLGLVLAGAGVLAGVTGGRTSCGVATSAAWTAGRPGRR